MISIEDKFLEFLLKNHPIGSGAPKSYVTAINKLNIALRRSDNFNLLTKYFRKNDLSVWNIRDEQILLSLYEFVKREQKKDNGGIFCGEQSPSYWKKGWISAAIKQFSGFVSIYKREILMMTEIDKSTNAETLAKHLDSIPLFPNPLLLEDTLEVKSQEGKSVLREVLQRQNQDVFRKMILRNYQYQCCLTGLPMVEVLRASHISPWAQDLKNRLNPENGLCLSATYDAAFDRHLISFDEDYRLILAPSLKKYCNNDTFKKQFKNLEGTKITMPIKYFPSQIMLKKHRDAMK